MPRMFQTFHDSAEHLASDTRDQILCFLTPFFVRRTFGLLTSMSAERLRR
jgi:hypothetical protein